MDLFDSRHRPRPLTNILVAVRPGRYELKAGQAAVTTFKGFFTVQSGDYLDITALIPNLGPAYTAKISYSLISATGPDDNTLPVTPTGGAWTAGQTFTVAAGGSSAGLASETVVFTKAPRFNKRSLARTDSPTRARAVVAWMLQVDAGTQMTTPNIGSYGWQYENQYYPQAKVSSQAVAGVDNPANYTNTARTPEGNPGGAISPFHIGFQYTTSKWGEQFYDAGDSIVEGLGGDARWLGIVQRAACNMSTPDKPVEWFNGGQHAQTPDIYFAELVQNLDLVRPTQLYVSFYSVNMLPAPRSASAGLADTSKMDEVIRGMATVSRAVAALPRHPRLFCLPALPNSLFGKDASNNDSGATTGTNDALRLTLNTFMGTMGNDPTVDANGVSTLANGKIINRQGWTLVKGLAEAVSDPTPVNGQIVPIASLMGTDRVHWNEAGLVAQTAVLEPYARAG